MAYQLTETLPKTNTRYSTERNRHVSMGVLCDGMGGEGNGSICSRLAVQAFGDAFAETGSFNTMWFQRLRMSLYAANAAIHEFKQTTSTINTNSGTTLISAVISDDTLYYVSVGDSPIFLFRRDESGYYTRTRVNATHAHWAHYYYKDGTKYMEYVSKEEAEEINKNRTAQSYCKAAGLYSALCGREIGWMDGSDESGTGIPLKDGDIIILCSDGVSNTLSETDMINIIYDYSEEAHKPRQIAEALIEKVLEASLPKQDNATCVVFKIHIK